MRFPILLALLVPLVAFAQWDQRVLLSDDDLYHWHVQGVVDDSFRLHVFDAHRVTATPTPNSLHYHRFNNWGSLQMDSI